MILLSASSAKLWIDGWPCPIAAYAQSNREGEFQKGLPDERRQKIEAGSLGPAFDRHTRHHFLAMIRRPAPAGVNATDYPSSLKRSKASAPLNTEWSDSLTLSGRLPRFNTELRSTHLLRSHGSCRPSSFITDLPTIVRQPLSHSRTLCGSPRC
ncbi:hypothetical protein BDW66DRAFT_92123 [Aspergillus desertorum]